MLAVCVTLTALLVLADAHPHHQQQLLYHPVQGSPGSFYYIPQANAASFSSVQRYAAPLPLAGHLPVPVPPGPPQYVLLYPGGPQHNFIHHRADEEATDRPTIWNLFNFFQRPTTTTTANPTKDVTTEVATTTSASVTTASVTTAPTTVGTTVEETTPKPATGASAKPEKIVGEKEIMMAVEQAGVVMADKEKAPLETLDENIPPNPQPTDERRFTLIQSPQFFGNYDLLRQRDMQQNLGIQPGAAPNFVLFRHGFAKPAQGQPGRPLKMEAESERVPGAAALAFRQAMIDARFRALGDASSRNQLVSVPHALVPRQQVLAYQRQLPPPGHLHIGPSHQNVYVLPQKPAEPAHAVVVDADRPKKDEKGDSDGVEAEQAGPSVAQAKPQAIALAGVGGMAAAAPVATAVVGPGGLAVSAPTATAVAGPSGGGSLVGPAQAAVAAVNKHVNKGGKVKVKANYDYRDDDRYH